MAKDSKRGDLPAHPVPDEYIPRDSAGNRLWPHRTGMTIREVYAGWAMKGLLAGYLASPEGYEVKWAGLARESLAAADALLAALAEEKP